MAPDNARMPGRHVLVHVHTVEATNCIKYSRFLLFRQCPLRDVRPDENDKTREKCCHLYTVVLFSSSNNVYCKNFCDSIPSTHWGVTYKIWRQIKPNKTVDRAGLHNHIWIGQSTSSTKNWPVNQVQLYNSMPKNCVSLNNRALLPLSDNFNNDINTIWAPWYYTALSLGTVIRVLNNLSKLPNGRRIWRNSDIFFDYILKTATRWLHLQLFRAIQYWLYNAICFPLTLESLGLGCCSHCSRSGLSKLWSSCWGLLNRDFSAVQLGQLVGTSRPILCTCRIEHK